MPVRLWRPTSEDGILVQAEAEAGEGEGALVPQGAGKVQVAAAIGRARGHGERSRSVPFGIGSLVHRRIFLYLIVTTAGVLWHLLCKVVFLMLSHADPCLCRESMRHDSYIPAQLGHLLSNRGKQRLATSWPQVGVLGSAVCA